ncbi:MAG: tRNA adenosine(34) deaminase TadA [Cyanobacteriota bacterium]|nr:tRNA adenosine(34) deaminase TadA [Cyanobacteriota bacterium]
MLPQIPPPEIDDPIYLTHRRWMIRALELAQEAGEAGEIPVGAAIVDGAGKLVATGANRRERDRNPIAHAEILAIQQAARVLQTWRLSECTLYVTLEPCPMCAGAIVQGRLGLLVYGAHDPKTGAIRTALNLPDSPCSNHRLKVLGGILESACREQLQTWFARRRET